MSVWRTGWSATRTGGSPSGGLVVVRLANLSVWRTSPRGGQVGSRGGLVIALLPTVITTTFLGPLGLLVDHFGDAIKVQFALIVASGCPNIGDQ